MKWVILALVLATLACFVGAWAIDRFGGPDAQANMDSLPLSLLGIALLAVTALAGLCWLVYIIIWS